MDLCLFFAALLHALFMLGELFPWHLPLVLKKASRDLPPTAGMTAQETAGAKFTTAQINLVATLVHNAGIYNGIIAGGLPWASFAGSHGSDVARILLLGAVAAGIFGTITLKVWPPAVQAGLSLFCLFRL